MITTEEIAVRVYQMLMESEVKTMITGSIDYERNDYSKEDVIIVPHAIDRAFRANQRKHSCAGHSEQAQESTRV